MIPVVAAIALLLATNAAASDTFKAFEDYRNGNELLEEYKALIGRHSNEWGAVRASLKKRGASCGPVPSRAKGTVECVYFFCRGRALQSLFWRFPVTEPIEIGFDAGWIDYRWTGNRMCIDGTDLKEAQREHLLKYSSKIEAK
jgi:hypothetical protein